MSAPVTPFSQLTLDEMPPATLSNSRAASQADSTTRQQYPVEDSSSDLESDSDGSDIVDDDEEAPAIVRSPAKLTYRVDHLSGKTQTAVRDVFGEPPKIALQRCRLINNTYAFQMTELVTRSVRIRAANGDGSSSPRRLTCSCGEDDEPCEHLLWLLDQVTKQTLYNHDRSKPLTMTAEGFAAEMGDPFSKIAEHHLDVLADGLHCPVLDPDALDEEELVSHRVREARELLASVYAASPDDFRPDLFDRPATGKKVLKRNDLDCTVFRMLLDNHHFFQYFLSVARPTDPVNDPFRKLHQRVDRVLRSFDAYASSSSSSSASSSSSSSSSMETPRDVPWAAKHLLGCASLIRSSIYTRDRPLQPSEAISAARTLVHMLAAVVSRDRNVAGGGSSRLDRNLYLHLVGDRDRDFVIAELSLLPEAASQFLHNLEAIFDDIGARGAPASYFDKYKKLLARLRTPTTGSGLKRQGQGQGAYPSSKRMK